MTDRQSQAVDPSSLAARRERRAAQRRAQILDAAETVFAVRGYHGATTREIAHMADLSEGTLYNYFPSKRDLFIGLMTSRTGALVESIADVRASGAEGAMAQLLASQFTRMRTQRHLRLFLQEARLDPDLRRALVEDVLPRISQEVEHLMQTLMEAGAMRHIDPQIASWTLLGAVVGLALFSDLEAAPALQSTSAEALAAQVSDIFIHGLHG